jgi:MFS transporter, DHA3 family, macrolide efflux protein
MNRSSSRYKQLLIQNRKFRNLWLGQTLSFTGNAVYDITLMWFVFEKTGSAFQVSLVLVASFLPELIFGMFFGAFADRTSKKRLMQISDLLSCIVLLLLSITFYFGKFQIWQIYVVTVCLSLLGLLFSIAQGAWLPEIVEQDHLMTANSLMATSRQITRLVGSAVGGALVALIGSTVAIAYVAVTFLASFVFVQLIPYVFVAREQIGASNKTSLFAEIGEGVRWLLKQRILLIMVILGMFSNIALGPTNVLPAIYIKSELHLDARALGFFDAAIGFGILLGSILIGYLSPKKVGLWFTVGLGLQGVSMYTVSQAPNLYIACAGNFLLGAALFFTALPMSTLFQILTPKDKRGRVNSILSMSLNMAIPITYGGIGILSNSIGSRSSYALGAALFLLCAIIALLSGPVRQASLNRIKQSQAKTI